MGRLGRQFPARPLLQRKRIVLAKVGEDLAARYLTSQAMGADLLARYRQPGEPVGADLAARYAARFGVGASLLTRYRSSQPVGAVLLARYAPPMVALAELAARYRTPQGTGQALPARYSAGSATVAGRVSVDLAARYKSARTVRQDMSHAYWAQPQDVTAGVSQYEAAWTGSEAEPQLQITLTAGGQDLEGAPSGLQITHNESAAARWQLTIMDSTGKYHPHKNGGDWEGVMDAQAFDANDTVTKTFNAAITYAGHNYRFVGVPDAYGHARSWQSRAFDFVWSGIDLSARLFRKAQRLETIRAEREERLTQIDLLNDLLPRYVGSYSLIGLPPVRVRLQHRQDIRGGDGMQALLDLTMAQWRMRGNTLVCWQPGAAGRTWRYEGDAIMYEDSLQAQTGQIVNKVIVRRAVEGGKVQGNTRDSDETGTALYTFGVQTESFSPPVNALQWRVTGGGNISDVICRNSQGIIVSVLSATVPALWPTHLVGAAPHNVASVEYTWGAPPGVLAAGASGTIRFFGAPTDHAEVLPPGEPEPPAYVVEMPSTDYPHDRATASQGKYGLRVHELSPNPLLYGEEEAALWASAFLDRNCEPPDPLTCRVPLNLAMEVGDWVVIEDQVLGTADRRYITQVTHSIYDDPAQRFTRFTAINYGG